VQEVLDHEAVRPCLLLEPEPIPLTPEMRGKLGRWCRPVDVLQVSPFKVREVSLELAILGGARAVLYRLS
jgi:hypothetical protein